MTHVFQKLLGMGRGAASQGRLMPVGCSNEESMTMADLVCSINSNLAGFQSSLLPSQIQKGVSRARSDDTKSMTRKGAGVDGVILSTFRRLPNYTSTSLTF
jgi:hypothetical protein